MRLVAILGLLCAVFITSPVAANNRAFKQFIDEIKTEASKKGIDGKYLAALDRLRPNEEVQRLAARQPEYVKPIWSYLVHMVTEERLRLGRREL